MANVKLKGVKAKLVNEACGIKARIKEDEKRLKEIRKALAFKSVSTYVTLKGCTLTIGEAKVFAEIDPKKLATYFKRKNNLPAFYRSVKVQLTNLKKEAPQSDIDKLRPELDPNTKWTYK